MVFPHDSFDVYSPIPPHFQILSFVALSEKKTWPLKYGSASEGSAKMQKEKEKTKVTEEI